MRVLIACEESQRVCTAFREKGHEAYSCDLIGQSGGHPEWHIKTDVLNILNPNETFNHIVFYTQDNRVHFIDEWDLIIAHPPCTYLSNAGAARLYKKIDGQSWINKERFLKGMKAKQFFMSIYGAKCKKIAIENPVPSLVYDMPKYQQIIQPYQFGDAYSKKTCLWLKGLPELKPTDIVEPICSWVSGGSKKADGTPRENKGTKYRDSTTRSKTFYGIAKAMADQWGR